ncbi:MAG: hypothetical protein AAGA48_28675 [Myxococcota bacterium]
MSIEQITSDFSQQELALYMAHRKEVGGLVALDLIVGIFGVTGMGLVAAGKPALGFGMMVLHWISISVFVVLSVMTMGLSLCIAPVFWWTTILSAFLTAQAVNEKNRKWAFEIVARRKS